LNKVSRGSATNITIAAILILVVPLVQVFAQQCPAAGAQDGANLSATKHIAQGASDPAQREPGRPLLRLQ